MAYVKPFKVIQDSYVTYKDWNELDANDLESWTLLTFNHLVAQDGLSAAVLGEHDDYLLPIGVVHVKVETFGGVVSISTDANEVRGGTFLVERLDVGLYRVSAPELYEEGGAPFGHVGVDIRELATGSPTEARVNFNDGTGNGGSFVGFEIEILSWDSSGPVWVSIDLTFTLTVFRGRQ